jgi:hypothetical protein
MLKFEARFYAHALYDEITIDLPRITSLFHHNMS